MNRCTYTLATAPTPGAIAVIQITGPAAAERVAGLIGRRPDGLARLVRFDAIDEGLAVALHAEWVQLMPHGGPRVVRLICDRLEALGVAPARELPPRLLYPEASSDFEADLLHTLAIAASPAAIDPLLAQAERWRAVSRGLAVDRRVVIEAADVLDRLVHPPTVALVGAANVGKSTLSNLVLGRAASITADLPGTTRDWVGGLAELATDIGHIAVRWIDTPGTRGAHERDDPIERRAIELSAAVIAAAEVRIGVRCAGHDLPRIPGRAFDLTLWNKSDTDPMPAEYVGDSIATSALTGAGLDAMSQRIASRLKLDAASIGPAPLWAFCPTLRRWLAEPTAVDLAAYLGQ